MGILYNGILYMSLATFSMEVAIWGKKFQLFYMASFRTFRITFHTFHTDLCRSRYTSIRQYDDKEIRIRVEGRLLGYFHMKL
ncbi:MAG: hypothetical protein EGR29_00155 [Faecalibacterium prausnitzii]|nr:hypothetical protein [Faecalibacterium prausnitzii]